MFNPKSWGHAASSIFGDGIVYKAGAFMGCTRLQVAATQGKMDDVKKFVEAGDDIKVINPKGNTALDDAIRERHHAIRDYLIAKGAKRSSELQ